MKVYKPPFQIDIRETTGIFLAGTIDMGGSEDWQAAVEERFKDEDVHIFNPRRDHWDSSWLQSFSNPEFYQQVNWELDALDKCDLIIMNFLPKSSSPITLVELGLYAKSRKIVVCCPDEYYRAGNVQIVCDRFSIPMFKDMDALLNYTFKTYFKTPQQ